MNETGITMDDKTADTIRCFAHEVIIKLMNADREMALVLLRDHANSALELVRSRQPSLAAGPGSERHANDA